MNAATMAISIHAPTRGATLFPIDLEYVKVDFNPRSYKRSDLIDQRIDDFMSISIHAPTRGATAKMHNNPYTYL